jgi:hypothetical protein
MQPPGNYWLHITPAAALVINDVCLPMAFKTQLLASLTVENHLGFFANHKEK